MNAVRVVRRSGPEGRAPSRAETLELLHLHRGADAAERAHAVALRACLESRGLIRRRTRMAPDGREVPDGYDLTAAGLAFVAALRGERDAGGPNTAAPGEVVRADGANARPHRVTTVSKET